ncbi:hypothetical protein BCV69DRAFT_301364 [Microstroma glucosiphilum]|uniref:Uncharacterized protein n=1 Tax=Pseudomicrostroma glucosiphilum TaxID=1684307 RepID=A0A316TY04_9BASI|nr:hypothetical protein BCV69DRAFT_301364 [Pseudomicrostroma glucosiphilum]PWN18219.1 hypothetical protein BCV69DRAFT_301364 [Pseudomicrostroma glucosiphilum]
MDIPEAVAESLLPDAGAYLIIGFDTAGRSTHVHWQNGTDRSPDWLKCRREGNLANFDDSVASANGTKCFEGPEKRHRRSQAVGALDPTYRAWMKMLRYLGYMEVWCRSKGQPPRAESYQAMSDIRGLLMRHVGGPLDAGDLPCRPFETCGGYAFFDYTITDGTILRALDGQDCLFGLVVGEPSIGLDTFVGCDPVQRHLFAGISFQIKPVAPSTPSSTFSPPPTDDWTPLQLKQKGLSSKRARDLAEVLLRCLPAEEQTRRRQRTAAEAWVARSRRHQLLEDYESLSRAAQQAFDGDASLWSGQNLLLGGKMCRRLQGDHVRDDERLAILQALGYPDMGAPVPVRFVVKTDNLAGSFKTLQDWEVPDRSARSNCRGSLLPRLLATSTVHHQDRPVRGIVQD